jgi:hypothetical protein
MIGEPVDVALVVIHELDDHVRDCDTGGRGAHLGMGPVARLLAPISPRALACAGEPRHRAMAR